MENRLHNKEEFEVVFEGSGYKLYAPVSVEGGYHTLRYVDIELQALYASSGGTPEVFGALFDEILTLCNTGGDVGTRFTDIGTIVNMLKYRLAYPVDQHCSVRVGCLLTFIEFEDNGITRYENPDVVSPYFTDKKVDLALSNPDLYAFFLTLGAHNIGGYRGRLDILESGDYFQKREEAIRGLRRLG